MIRTRKNLTRITVAGSSVALFAGLAVPAYACTPPESAGLKPIADTAHPAILTVAGLKAKLDSFVAKRLAALSVEARKVTASTRLTDPQKAAIQARIAVEVGALVAVKAEVDAETTVAGIKADLAAARLAALKAHVDARIDGQVARLDAMLATVQASARLTDAKKLAFAAKIQAKVAALAALKAKVDSETTAQAVLTDLRAAGALWDWRDHGRHGAKTDPGAKGHDGKVVSAVWTKNGHRSNDPNGARVVTAGRGHASSCAGHHGFGGSHHRHGGGVRHA